MAKGPEAFRTISEASGELGVPQHVLRFWETKFTFVKPMKRAGGRRFYRPQDIAILASVRSLLHDQGYTIKGVQKLHRERGMKQFGAAPPDLDEAEGGGTSPSQRSTERLLHDARRTLEAAKQRLDAALAKR